MRAAAYARYSSDLQRETSIDDQVATARRYAEQQGWTLLDEHVYSDAGISGASLEGRPRMQALLAAATSATPPPFDVVLVDDTSRFARDIADAIRAVQRLTFCGVRVVFISQGVDTASDQAETLIAVHGVVDQLYIRELKHKIKRGLEGQLRRGFHTGARIYGYRSVPVHDPSGKHDTIGPLIIGKRLEVDPVQAEVICQIYRWYLDGVSHAKMVDRLNAMDAPTPRGTRWTKHHTDRILSNERYLGRHIWGQTTSRLRPGTNKIIQRPRPRDEWQIADRPELRIIDDDLFQRVAARREALKASLNMTATSGLARGRSGLYSKHLLVGLSRCGTCGKAFTIASGGYGSPRYGCPNSHHNGRLACDNRQTIRAKIVDPIVLAELQRQLLEPSMVRMITDAVTAEVSRMLTSKPAKRDTIRARRDATARKLANLIEVIESGMTVPTVTEQIAKREAELRQLDKNSPSPITRWMLISQ